MAIEQGNTGKQITLDWDKPTHIDTSRAAMVLGVNGDGTVNILSWNSTTPGSATNLQAVDVGGTPPAGSEGHTVVYFQKT